MGYPIKEQDNKAPLVSICMPLYNVEKYIRDALDSLLTQDYKNFELIISDNASTDRTQEICLDYVSRDRRIRYYRSERNMGPVWNFNRVFEISSGEYFMWASYDDYWKPQYISLCLNGFCVSGSIVLVGAMCEAVKAGRDELIFVDKGFSTVGLSHRERFMRYKSIVHSGRHIGAIFFGVYKRNALKKVMPIRNVFGTDHLILAKLCFEGEFFTVEENLMVKRWGMGVSASLRNMARAQGINNEFLIRCPYFVREIFFQKIIFNTDKLTASDKIKLSGWSLNHYFRICCIPAVLTMFPVWLRRFLKGALSNIRAGYSLARANLKIKRYIGGGQKPWTQGYAEYKEMLIHDILRNQELLDIFLYHKILPDRYGFRIDERVIEYPWFFSRLKNEKNKLLDAGSSLNHKYIIDLPFLNSRSIVIYNLSTEGILRRSNVSYIYGDLRNAYLDTESFDEIACISTLEHIGMDNTLLYSKDKRLKEFQPDDYKKVINEFRRILKPGGRLFITVPFGRYRNLGWLQQFDYQRINTILKIFNGSSGNVSYFRYLDDGWQVAIASECADCSYFDIHIRKDYDPDYVAAARAVACIELVK